MDKFLNLFRKAEPKPEPGEHIDKATEALATSVGSIVNSGEEDKAPALAKTFTQFNEYLRDFTFTKAGEPPPPNPDKQGDATMSEATLKALGLENGASEEQVMAAIEALKARKPSAAEEKAEGEEEKKKRAKAAADEIAKRDAALPEDVRKRLAEAEAMTQRIAKLEDEAELVGYRKQAVEIGLPEAEGLTLQKAYRGDKESIAKLAQMLKSAQSAVREAGLFKEFGASGGDQAATPLDEITAKAKELRKANPSLTEAQAFSKAYSDPANAELARRERNENRPRVG